MCFCIIISINFAKKKIKISQILNIANRGKKKNTTSLYGVIYFKNKEDIFHFKESFYTL
jgi:hypothetical protein